MSGPRRGLRGQSHISKTLGPNDPRHYRQGQAWLVQNQEDNRTIEKVNGKLATKIHPSSRKYLVETPEGIFLDLAAISADLPP